MRKPRGKSTTQKNALYLELIEEEWVARVGCIVNLVDGTIILKKSLSQQ
jgi:hypothetical protein